MNNTPSVSWRTEAPWRAGRRKRPPLCWVDLTQVPAHGWRSCRVVCNPAGLHVEGVTRGRHARLFLPRAPPHLGQRQLCTRVLLGGLPPLVSPSGPPAPSLAPPQPVSVTSKRPREASPSLSAASTLIPAALTSPRPSLRSSRFLPPLL